MLSPVYRFPVFTSGSRTPRMNEKSYALECSKRTGIAQEGKRAKRRFSQEKFILVSGF